MKKIIIKGEIDSSTIIVGDFNTPLTTMDRWTKQKLEPIIQSEVSQKDKEYYSILTHIYGI